MVNIQHNVWVSQRFLDEIENVAHSSPYIDMVVVYMVILLMLTTLIMELG